MKKFAMQLIGLGLWLYCLYQDYLARSLWWALGDGLLFPLGVVRGFLKLFGVI